jgi:hypothetical protein
VADHLEQMDATTVVPPKAKFSVDASGTMHLALEPQSRGGEA